LAAWQHAPAGSTGHGGGPGERRHAGARPWRIVARLALLLLLLLAALSASGQREPMLRGTTVAAQQWLDGQGQASLADAQAAIARAGRPADPQQVIPLGPNAAVWYRLEFPRVAAPTRAVFRVTFPGTDHVDLYRLDAAGTWRVQHSGDHLAVNEWPLRSLDPAFIFTIQPGEPPSFLRVENSQPIRVKWALQDASAFLETLKMWHLGLGAYAGFVAMVVLLSVFNAVSWRDPIHLYYLVHVVLVSLSVMALTGLGNEYLWPASPWWADRAPVVIPGLAIAWAGLFVRELVAERGGKVISRVLLAYAAGGVVMLAAFLLLGREHVYRAPSVYALPGLALLLGIVGWYSLRRPQVGLWVLGGITMLAIGALIPLLENLGALPPSRFAEAAPQVGAALEIPLVLIGLFFRSRERRVNRQRLEQLATRDPLTGLATHRVLLRRLEQLLKQARRDRGAGAVFHVHVANLAEIAAEFGREAGEAALMRAAECLAKDAREGDLVARDAGNDLVLVLGGRIDQATATAMGRDIIARGLKFSARLPPRVVVKLRVAGVCSPLPHTDAEGLLHSLARLLLDMENDEQGRWLRFIGSSDSSSWRRTSSATSTRPREEEEVVVAPTAEEIATLSAPNSRPPRSSPVH
jgi:two-component system, sensor histidine kinase LadS